MKRFLNIILIAFAFLLANVNSMQSQIFSGSYTTFYATSYAYASVNAYTGSYSWSNWYDCSVKIVVDFENDIVIIYSNKTQYYKVLSTASDQYDRDGGRQMIFNVIDAEDDIGTLRFRVTPRGDKQLYVDFRNVAWVYNIY